MHYAAELGFLYVAKTLVRKCPKLLAVKTEDQRKLVKKRAMLPVESAIVAEKDDVSSFLIRVMWPERYKHRYYLTRRTWIHYGSLTVWYWVHLFLFHEKVKLKSLGNIKKNLACLLSSPIIQTECWLIGHGNKLINECQSFMLTGLSCECPLIIQDMVMIYLLLK